MTASLPYIIQLENTSGADIDDVVLFKAFSTITATNFGLDPAIVVSMGTSDVSYKQLLYQSMQMPFRVGKTYLDSDNTSQITQVWNIKSYDSNGNKQSISNTHLIDPYQYQAEVLTITQNYLVTGHTSINISKLLANATIKIYLYPSINVNIARAL